MATASDTGREGWLPHMPFWVGSCILLVMIVFLLTTEHRAHVLGVVPYLLLLLCPIIHLFMHRGHGDHGAHRTPDGHIGKREGGGLS